MSNFNYQAVADTIANNRTNASYAAGFGTLLNTALQSYRQHILDQQANKTLAVMDAPKATAVTDANGNPIIDDTDATDANGVTDPTKEADWNAGVIDADHPDGYSYTPGKIPDEGGVAGLQMRMALNKQQTSQTLAQTRVQNLMNLMNNRTAKATASSDPNSLAAQRLTLQQQMEKRRADAAAAKATAAVDPATTFNKYLQTNAGITLPQWQNLQGSHMVRDIDPATNLGTGDPNGDSLEATLNGKTIHIPKPVYSNALALYQSVLQARSQPAAVATGGLPQGPSAPTGALFGAGATTGGAPAAVAPAAGGTVRVLHPDGVTTGVIPASQLDAALVQGYTQL